MGDVNPESGRDANTRDALQKIGRTINEELPQNWGFFLMCFPLGSEPGRMNYVSNAERASVVALMKEWIEKEEALQGWGKHV